jgi:tripartite-type tricarboxylate transporter receptor subunit TctC
LSLLYFQGNHMIKSLVSILAVFFCAHAWAWQPSKSIVAYIGYAPGSGNEISFRGVAAEIERTNPGVKFVIQNMPGGDGSVSVNHSSKLPADGLSLNVTGNLSTWVTNEAFNPEILQYKLDDLLPVLSLATSPQVIVAHPSSKIQNAREFAKYIQSPGKPVNVAIGSTVQYLIFGLVMTKGNGDKKQVKQIMYKGPMQALVDTVSGHTEFGMMPLSVAAPQIKAGKVRLIALTGTQRLPGFEKADVMNEVLPGVIVNAMWNITLPKNTPPDIVDWYVKTFSTAIKSPNVKRYFEENYMIAARDLDPASARRDLDRLRQEYLPISLKLRKEMDK